MSSLAGVAIALFGVIGFFLLVKNVGTSAKPSTGLGNITSSLGSITSSLTK